MLVLFFAAVVVAAIFVLAVVVAASAAVATTIVVAGAVANFPNFVAILVDLAFALAAGLLAAAVFFVLVLLL